MSKKTVSSYDDHPFRIEWLGKTQSCRYYEEMLFVKGKQNVDGVTANTKEGQTGGSQVLEGVAAR